MIHALREKVRILPGGKIEITDAALPDGASAEVIVLVETQPPQPLRLPVIHCGPWPIAFPQTRSELYDARGR